MPLPPYPHHDQWRPRSRRQACLPWSCQRQASPALLCRDRQQRNLMSWLPCCETTVLGAKALVVSTVVFNRLPGIATPRECPLNTSNSGPRQTARYTRLRLVSSQHGKSDVLSFLRVIVAKTTSTAFQHHHGSSLWHF